MRALYHYWDNRISTLVQTEFGVRCLAHLSAEVRAGELLFVSPVALHLASFLKLSPVEIAKQLEEKSDDVRLREGRSGIVEIVPNREIDFSKCPDVHPGAIQQLILPSRSQSGSITLLDLRNIAEAYLLLKFGELSSVTVGSKTLPVEEFSLQDVFERMRAESPSSFGSCVELAHSHNCIVWGDYRGMSGDFRPLEDKAEVIVRTGTKELYEAASLSVQELEQLQNCFREAPFATSLYLASDQPGRLLDYHVPSLQEKANLYWFMQSLNARVEQLGIDLTRQPLEELGLSDALVLDALLVDLFRNAVVPKYGQIRELSAALLACSSGLMLRLNSPDWRQSFETGGLAQDEQKIISGVYSVLSAIIGNE